MATKKVNKKSLVMPKDLDEVNDLVAEIGDIDQLLLKEKVRTDRLIARVRQDAKARVAERVSQRAANIKRITKFAKKNRDTILPVDRKSLELAAGMIGWRFGPAKVAVSSEEQTLVTWLEANKMPRFLRYSIEVNREQLLEERPEYVPGVHFEQKEFFFIEPNSETLPETTATVVDMVRIA